MERQFVHSSNIRSIGYDAKTHVLEIEFHNDRIYSYADVPEGVYLGLLDAPSVGKYFFGRILHKFAEQEITPVKQDTLDKDGAP